MVYTDAITQRKGGFAMGDENNRISREVYETAVCFARMWGVMETLHPFPYLEFSQVLDMVTGWAQDYVDGGGEDMTGFFQKKAKEASLLFPGEESGS